MTSSTHELLNALGIHHHLREDGNLKLRSPINGELIAALTQATACDMSQAIDRGSAAFRAWRQVPAPRRGELVRLFADELRSHKQMLGQLVTLEVGKVTSEGEGEVQEMIDICDFAVGLSRQLYGLTIASERPGHRMMEQWQPLGVVGVISAFNFPVAVWAWNAALALVCGNSVVWKPSDKTPLTALAANALLQRAIARFGNDAPDSLSQVLIGGGALGEAMANDNRVALVSATGSTRMGQAVGTAVARRLGRSLLELGGNNAIVVTASADMDLALRAILFGAYGTAGQRCTTTRRVIAHHSIHDALVTRLDRARDSLRIGDPRSNSVLIGPLIDQAAFDAMQQALERAQADGGIVSGGQRVLSQQYPDAWYVSPALVRMPAQTSVVRQETFAPLLYVLRYHDFDEALALHNDVPQGLSSAIFTSDLRESELFLGPAGSDCGIANVNIGTSGAEIGGAFGGEKETGGGRESGSDAWRNYMRRATNTINYSRDLPLAQGVRFDF